LAPPLGIVAPGVAPPGHAGRSPAKITHSKLISNFGDELGSSAIGHSRGTGNHPESMWIQASELGDHLLCKTVGEILLLRISPEVLKRKHGNHASLDVIGGGMAMHGRHEAVTAVRQSLDETRVVRIIAECGTELMDDDAETVIEVDKCIGRPELFAQLFACDYFARALQRDLQ
jgi:hypothetical protein